MIKEYIKNVLINEGLFNFPQQIADEIFNWAATELKEYSSKQGRISSGLNAEKQFRINLSDWKYGDLLDDYIKKSNHDTEDLVSHLRSEIAKRREEGKDISKEKEEEFIDTIRKGNAISNQNSDKIKVKLQLAPAGSQFGATWQERASTMFLYWHAGQTLADLKKSIEHELTHMAQTILSKVKGAKAGYPFKKIKMSDEHPEHDLQDIKFYTVLRDEIEDAKRKNLSVEEVLKTSNFFKILRKKDRDKFRKAVRELYKNLNI